MSTGAGTASEEAAARIAARSAEIVERSEKAFKEETPLFVKMVDRTPAAADNANRQPDTAGNPAEDEEYEIVYVTEDELEEGEEYEIEYVDDLDEDVEYEIEYVDEADLEEGEEYEVEYVEEEQQPDTASGREPVKNSAEPAVDTGKETDELKNDNSTAVQQEGRNDAPDGAAQQKAKDKHQPSGKPQNTEPSINENNRPPVIPHFKKSESVASVPSEKVARMAKAITTDQKYSGLISRAVKQREKAEEEAAVAVEKSETITTAADADRKKDTGNKKSAGKKGKSKKSVRVDEDYEIMEF